MTEVLRRWGTVPLVDMLKETVLRTGCLDAITSVTTDGSIRPEVLAELKPPSSGRLGDSSHSFEVSAVCCVRARFSRRVVSVCAR